MKKDKKYLVNIHEFYDVEIYAPDKDKAKERAEVLYLENPKLFYNGYDVAAAEEISDDEKKGGDVK